MEELVQLRDENQRLRKAVDELSILNDLARVISSTMSLDEVIENVVKRSVRAVKGEQGMITLVDEVQPMEMKTFIRALDSTGDHKQFHLNQNVLGWMMINKKPLISNDISTDSRFSGVSVQGMLRSLLCVPLLVKNRLVGILAIFNKKNLAEFSEDDKRLLSILAAQSGQILENARLYQQEQKKMVMEKELIAAREVQTNLLPKQVPQLPNFQIAARTIPAQEIGGDFYDFIRMDDNRYEVVIADVAGKGLPAALLATLGKGVLYAHALQDPSPKVHLKQSNRILRGSVPRKSFITMLLAVVDSDARSVTISNAGQCYPVLFRKNTNATEFLTIKGMPLNFTDDIMCDECTLHMEPGDCMVLYSDGVSEAQNSMREFFGDERVQTIVSQHAHGPADFLLQKIIDDVKLYSKGIPQSDDITVIVVKAAG
jgi:serine phosphatase RsbU (regulator of sigma subunit)